MLENIFEDLKKKIGHIKAIVLVDKDGIELEKSMEDSFPHELLCAEITNTLKIVDGFSREMELGKLEELSIKLSDCKIIVNNVSPDYRLVIIMDDEGSIGLARYSAIKYAAPIIELLG